MPAQIAPIYIEAGSYEPLYWSFTHPDTGDPLNLTESGYQVSGIVSDREDGLGRVLHRFVDTDFRRDADGRVWFEPSSTTTSAWARLAAFYQFRIAFPSGQSVRFAEGPFEVSPALAQ